MLVRAKTQTNCTLEFFCRVAQGLAFANIAGSEAREIEAGRDLTSRGLIQNRSLLAHLIVVNPMHVLACYLEAHALRVGSACNEDRVAVHSMLNLDHHCDF